MVDFTKRLVKKDSGQTLDPIAIYETLDRESDKGPLRPVQLAVLKEWHEQRRNERDLILKLHTGQGKTLIGLLMLHSKLNEDGGPTVYLCPNNYLIRQTSLQAKQFGVPHCMTDGDLPDEFLEGKALLITSVQKLFNGLTKFGTGPHSIPVSALLMDDCHACIDAIRDSSTIKLDRTEPAYSQILNLFAGALENQGSGTYADIKNGSYDFLPVPYWDWRGKEAEIVDILSKQIDKPNVKYAWPLIRNIVKDCQCIVSGQSLEIAPYLAPLEQFESYYKAKHRFFMSATVTDDSFLAKGLRLSPETIRKPLVYEMEGWSGEKMILIPSLINPDLDRSAIVNFFGKPKAGRKFGTVILVPSKAMTLDWEKYGAVVATKETITQEIQRLREGKCEAPLVIVNRYDGIDLPDSMCRILIFDSKPYSESLIDRYADSCRATSEVTAVHTSRTIEQGLGRSVRGEKDYCVIIVVGADLVKTIRAKVSRKHLSSQTRAQVEIGLEVAAMAKEEDTGTAEPINAFIDLINQCLKRDGGWKAFYSEKMENVGPATAISGIVLEIFQMELEAELKFQHGSPSEAVSILQGLIDKHIKDHYDRGWYLQEIARYTQSISKTDSNVLQVQAHRQNMYLMKPREGMHVDKLKVISQQRMQNIISWVRAFKDYGELSVALEDILGRLEFGVKADRFERAFDELGQALGFSTQRPEKQWKEGPDNLWGIRDAEFLVVECKSEVDLNRAEINKHETGQMNNSCAWFAKEYPGAKATRIIIIPTRKLSNAAGFNVEVNVMSKKELGKLTTNARAFFAELKVLDFNDLSEKSMQTFIDAHSLSVDSVLSDYSKPAIS